MEVLGLALSVFSIGYGFWQSYKAHRAERDLRNVLNTLPSKIADNVIGLVEPQMVQGAIEAGDHNSAAQYVDLDGDGKDELAIQFSWGLHGQAMQVFRISDDWDFQKVAELTAGVPADFLFEDVDHDGRLEVRVIESARDTWLPYAAGLRDVVWYRLIGGEFVEVGRLPHDPVEVRAREREIEEGGWPKDDDHAT